MPNEPIVAYDNNDDRIAWSASLTSGSSVGFIAASPYGRVIVAGGRFSTTGDSNLILIDANSGEVIRKMLGLESFDVTSSYWLDHQVLVSHATLTDRQVSGTSIVDRGFLKGLISFLA